MEKSALSVDFAVLCDDVRQEGNGKYIFIGVYNESVDIQETGTELNLQLVSKLRNTVEQKYHFELRALFNGEKKMELQGEITSAKSGAAFLTFPIIINKIDESGELSIIFREKGFEWEEIMNIPINVRSDD